MLSQKNWRKNLDLSTTALDDNSKNYKIKALQTRGFLN